MFEPADRHARRPRLFTYVVKQDEDCWRTFLDGHRAGRFRTEAEALAEAEKLAREACGVGGASRLVIARDHSTEVRLLRSNLFRISPEPTPAPAFKLQSCGTD